MVLLGPFPSLLPQSAHPASSSGSWCHWPPGLSGADALSRTRSCLRGQDGFPLSAGDSWSLYMCLRCQGQPAGRWQSPLGPRSGFRFSGMGSGNFTSTQGQLPAKPAQGPWVESRWLHGRSAACPPLLPHSMADKNGALKCTFSAPGHSTSLLQGLATLRAQGQLLDVVLTVNRETFHAHKVVLAACSDYFRAMFTGGMREASQDVIELKGVSARGLRHIIDFAYSAEVTLDLDCVQDVLGAAVFLQMLPVVELCEEFLKAAMSVETCLNIGHMATTFSLASLKESVDAFTFRHFLQIAEEEDFLHLPLERLVFFLQSNRLQSCAEIDLFRAAVRWLQHDPARRLRASHVLCHIRFPLMRSSDLVDSVQTLDIMVEDVLCRQYLLEAFSYQVLPFRQHEMQSSRTAVRSDVPSLVAFGGTPYTDSDRSVSSKVYQLPEPGARHFRELTEMEVGCSHTCVAVLDNFVYVAGGQHLQYRSGEGAVDACYRYDSVEDKKALHCYDPEADQWEFKAPMSEPRVLHAMVGAGGRIYALGGRMDHVDRCFDVLAVEYYVPETDQWTSVTPMRAGQSEAGCCLLDRKIYIVGGYNWRLNNVTGLVQVYNTETDEWERDLHFPESFAGIACAPVLLPRAGPRR
ncbi:PREDICTED: LOW QUALITY PROTEIN: kelch-like protein 26 [Bison bison bison]|uniref:LOW QUALITY PROTEIN: kelch-like protein 26 n=1 Tax=Bison bison bison TaxID=43346 RepID=A0A6P3I3X6_BISBB|nr:PREDICTED: LOW QUALITY PROTEIN: kelch-like protein 26 [Bison bison bison]